MGGFSLGAAALWLLCHVTMARPNFIVMQPDDFLFYDVWDPPALVPGEQGETAPSADIPNLERFRREGLQMMRAHAASTMCGTSRYSTMTGRYPSRAAGYAVYIPRTKLTGEDCSRHNLAAVLNENGYKTGVVGKWHLQDFEVDPYNYSDVVANIEACGFDVAAGIYPHNLEVSWTNNSFSHNTEYLTDQAIKFIDGAVEEGEDFFLYFNPTAPHPSGAALEALMNFTCLDTPEGVLEEEPVIPGMTEGIGCQAYRQTVLDRAASTSDSDLGAVWIDDAVGALFLHLETINQLQNTFFLFQLDHGKAGKSTIYETGSRIAQFVHYPDAAFNPGTKFDGLVSTIDVAPTIMEYAGISTTSPDYYQMDGLSWREAVEVKGGAAQLGDATIGGVYGSGATWNERCIFVEMGWDRSVTCGCDKMMYVDSYTTTTAIYGANHGLLHESYTHTSLCDANGNYVIAPNTTTEDSHAKSDPARAAQLQSLLNCHFEETNPDKAVFQYGVCHSPPITCQNLF